MTSVGKNGLHQILLIGLPVPLWIQAQEQFHDLLREFTLIAGVDEPVHPLPGRLLQIVDSVVTNYGHFGDRQAAQLVDAANAGLTKVDLSFSVPDEVVEAAVELGQILDEADEYCRTGEYLLSMATAPACRAYRQWYLEQFVEQAKGGRAISWTDWIAINQTTGAVDLARRSLLELSISAAGVGTFDWDLVKQTLVWDDRLIELFGYDAAEFDQTLEAFTSRLHPEDRARVQADLQLATATGGDLAMEYRIVLPSEEVRWVGARGRALGDENGHPVRLLGAAWDITAHRENEAQLARVLESMATAFFSLDTSWCFTYVNAEGERVLGRPRAELVGGNIWELFPAAVGSPFETHYRHAMSSGETVTFDAYYPAPLNAWYEVRAGSGPDGLAVYFLDVTARRQLQEQSEQAVERAALLAHITAELVAALDPDQAVERLSHLVVPILADWCVVTLITDSGQVGARRGLSDAGAWHADPAKRELVASYARSRLDAMTDDSIVVRAMADNTPQLIYTDALAELEPLFPDGPALDMLKELNPASVVILPLTGRNGPVGLLTLCNGPERAPFSDQDLATANNIAGRAGLVLDNARLYRQQRELAEGLQRSLLSAPPEPDHLQIIVRYTPATEDAQVGGDWYDAFLQPEGATVLVIGDVVGHDTVAAAAMGQVRTLVRGISVATGAHPRDVLSQVDHAMETLQLDATATAVVARLEQSEEEKLRDVTHLRWSNAGHPPPMVINPDGSVLALTDLSADLLLGVLPDAPRRESEVTLDRGSIVLLYTDGLVERRGQSLEEGLERLQMMLKDLGNCDLDHLCDQLLARLLPAHAEDDVALVAVKLHPQNKPRPAEAGPNRVPPNL